MPASARITVTAGPDRGRVYELTGEMIRLGRSPENEVVFTDAQIGDHHANIVCRDGRFAILSSLPDSLEIDGHDVPPERWVWLPEVATIRIGNRTSLEFSIGNSETSTGETPVAASAPAAPRSVGTASAPSAPAAARPSGTKTRKLTDGSAPGSDVQPRPKRTSADRSSKGTRTIARFITDGPGDPLVKLGEDGHLPELALHETQAGERPQAGPKQSNPAVLLGVLGLSLGLTILMLFLDVGSLSDNLESKDKARERIKDYYGAEGEPLKPYQEHLREACRAHSRRDFEAEKIEYRKVLALLRSEAKDKVNRYTGLTGRIEYEESSEDKKSDKHLEEQIGTLLRD
jgi:FHA domain